MRLGSGSLASGKLRFVLVGGGGPGGFGGFGGPGGSSDIGSWVAADCSAVEVGSGNGGTLYDCAAAGGA